MSGKEEKMEREFTYTTPVKPNLFVLSPLQPKGGWGVPPDKLGPEVCLATSFSPKTGQMVLNVKEGPIALNTTNAVLSIKQNTYFYAGFTNQTIYSCELNNRSSNNDNIDLCTDLHPENAKLNFYLLLMNGVRVLLTKTVAFSTLLTIRAMLF
ncbi:hypothetical protein PAMP_005388 [Pampus punctatissimus]